jgi:hypothetical protein
LWLSISDEHGTRRVGLSAGNIDAPGSAPDLAYLILLSRVSRTLKSPAKARENMVQFREEWALLEQSRAQVDAQQLQIKVASGAQASHSGTAVHSLFSIDEEPH